MPDVHFDVLEDDVLVDVITNTSIDDAGVTDAVVQIVTVEGPSGAPGPPGEGFPIVGESLSGVTGVNTIFVTANHFVSGSTAVYLNGLREFFYTETDVNKITLQDPPLPGDTLHIDYLIKDGT